MMADWYPEADLVIKHAKLYTVAIKVEEILEGKREFSIIEDSGVAVKDGKFIYVGDAEGADAYVGAHTETVDAAGKMLVPGYVESHMHLTFLGDNLRHIDFRDITTREGAKQLIRETAENTPDGQWILGNSWNELVWDEEVPLTLEELDELSPNNPLFAQRTCFHTATANSLALAAAGITADIPDPEGGKIGRTPDGKLSGLLYESPAISMVQAAIPPLSEAERVEGIEKAGAYLNSLGITSAIDCALPSEDARAYQAARALGKLSVRSSLMLYLDPARGDCETQLKRLDDMDFITGFGDDMLEINGVKIVLDGIPATYTALMREGYKTRPDYCGSSIWTQDEMTAMACKAHELGWQIGVHTIGDAATDMALNAFEEAAKAGPMKDRHNYVVHYQFPHEDQWPRMKALGIGATLQPTIVSTMGEAVLFYDEQAERIQSAGLMFANGIVCGGGSDAPIVPPDPMMGMYYAITRLDETTGNILSKGDESKVTPIEALIMWTKNAAWFMHGEDKLGSIEVGNLADMVLYPKDFIEADVEEYRTIKVDKTYLGGKLVYQAD